MPERTPDDSSSGTRPGAASARPTSGPDAEAEAFEREFPGASFRAVRTLRTLEVVGARAEGAIAEVARRHGMSHAALNALAVIEGSPDPLPAGEVGERMHITSGSTTSLLDTLEGKGLVERISDPADRRRVLVKATPAATDLLDEMLPEVQQAATAVMAGLSAAEVDQLDDLLRKVEESIAQMPVDPPAPPRRQR